MTLIRDFVRDLTKILGQQQAEEANKLMSGTIGSFDEYRLHVGIVKGLRQAGELAYQLMKKRDLADDDDEGQLGDMPPDGEQDS